MTCAGFNAHVTLTQSSQFKFLMQYRSILHENYCSAGDDMIGRRQRTRLWSQARSLHYCLQTSTNDEVRKLRRRVEQSSLLLATRLCDSYTPEGLRSPRSNCLSKQLRATQGERCIRHCNSVRVCGMCKVIGSWHRVNRVPGPVNAPSNWKHSTADFFFPCSQPHILL